MKKTLGITLIATIGAVLTLVTTSSFCLATNMLRFSPSSALILQPGQSVGVDILLSLDAGIDVSTFDLNVLYDDSVLSLTTYSLGNDLGVIGTDAEDWSQPATPGHINLSELSYLSDFSLQPDIFALATLYFTGLKQGSSALDFDSVIIGDAFGGFVTASTEAGSVNVVPEPSTSLMVGFGAIGLALLSLRRPSN